MSDKTIVDVTSETVDKIANGVKAISDAVTKVAPRAWESAVHYQKVQGYTDIGYFFCLVALMYIGYRAIMSQLSKLTDDDEALAIWRLIMTVVVFVTVLICGYTLLVDGIRNVANAEYFAAISLVNIVK